MWEGCVCVGGEGVWEKRVSMQGEGVREGRMCMRGECECVRRRYEGVEKVVSAMSVWPLGGVMCV